MRFVIELLFTSPILSFIQFLLLLLLQFFQESFFFFFGFFSGVSLAKSDQVADGKIGDLVLMTNQSKLLVILSFMH